MQLFQINQSEESSKITLNAHTPTCPFITWTAHYMSCPLPVFYSIAITWSPAPASSRPPPAAARTRTTSPPSATPPPAPCTSWYNTSFVKLPLMFQFYIYFISTSASKSSIREFVITEKAQTRAFSWLKAATTAFTHYWDIMLNGLVSIVS